MSRHSEYTAIIEKDGDTYGVTFPDLPGCVSAGDSFEEAKANAEEALLTHLVFSFEEGDEIPNPTSFEKIDAHADPLINVVAKVPIRVKLPGNISRVNITIDTGLLGVCDIAAEKLGLSRSAYLALSGKKLAEETLSSLKNKN